MFKRLIASLVCLTFSFSNLQYVHAQPAPQQAGDFSINQLPVPGTMVGESVPFAPLALKGLIVNPQKPLEFQFIVDTGKGPQGSAEVKDQANQLVKYFLAGLTIPEGDLWVNLSPYEKNRMVPQALGLTDLGRDLLAQDYILKQLTASLIYPEKDLGKEFWSRVYAKAQQQFGTTNVPVNTFNKVWILPDQAQIFENNNAAYVTKSTLKVMLDEDYLSLQKHSPSLVKEGARGSSNDMHALGSQIVREIVLPEIEKEVNTGKNFASLRQIYQALILAKWYKETIQNGLLDALYTNKNRVAGVNLNDPNVKEQIYNRYLQAYKKGAFNYIKEDPTPDGQVVPRKYFSGGLQPMNMILNRNGNQAMLSAKGWVIGALILLTVGLGVAIFNHGPNAPVQSNPPIDTTSQVQAPPVEENNNPSSNSDMFQSYAEKIIDDLAKDIGQDTKPHAVTFVELLRDKENHGTGFRAIKSTDLVKRENGKIVSIYTPGIKLLTSNGTYFMGKNVDAFNTLANFPALPQYRNKLAQLLDPSNPPSVRIAAAVSLRAMPSVNLTSSLIQLLRDPDPEVRLAAVIALGSDDTQTKVTALQENPKINPKDDPYFYILESPSPYAKDEVYAAFVDYLKAGYRTGDLPFILETSIRLKFYTRGKTIYNLLPKLEIQKNLTGEDKMLQEFLQKSYRRLKTDAAMTKPISPIFAHNYEGKQVELSNTGNVFEAVEKLVEQQVKVGVSIPFSRTGDLAAYFDKIDRGIFKVQVNPRRHPDNRVVIKSGKQGGDFLDPKNMPDEEAGFPLPGHDQYEVYPNPSPYEMNHIVLVGRGNETGTYPSQSLDTPEKIDAGLDFLSMVNQPDYNVTFNSTGAANSSPHFHWQAFQVDLPIEHLPVGDIRTDAEGIKTGFVQNYPAQVIYLEGKDKDALVNKVLKIIQRLTQGSEGKPIPYNVLLKMTSDKTYKVFIFPRNFETPSQGKEGLISSKFGILEMSGAVITYTADPRTAEGLFINSEKNQVKLTEDLIKESLQYASFQNRDFLKGIIDSAMSHPQAKIQTPDAAMLNQVYLKGLLAIFSAPLNKIKLTPLVLHSDFVSWFENHPFVAHTAEAITMAAVAVTYLFLKLKSGENKDKASLSQTSQQNKAPDAAMFNAITILKIGMMSDVNKISAYWNNYNSKFRQAAMNRIDKLAINSKLNEDVYIEAAKGRYIEVASWAVQNLQKSSYPTPIIAKIIKEYRQVEDLIKLLDSSSPVLRLNVARTLYEIKPSYLYVEHYPAHSEPELEYIDGFSWNGNTGYYPTGRTIEIPEIFVIINGFKRWDIKADKAMSNPQAKPQTQDAAMFGFLRRSKHKTLAEAVLSGDIKAARKFLEKGADPNLPDSGDDAQPIFYALHSGPQMVQLLIDHGADVNATSSRNESITPLALAILLGYNDVAAVLRRAKAELRKPDDPFWMDPVTRLGLNKAISEYEVYVQISAPHARPMEIADMIKTKISLQYPPGMHKLEMQILDEDLHVLILMKVGGKKLVDEYMAKKGVVKSRNLISFEALNYPLKFGPQFFDIFMPLIMNRVNIARQRVPSASPQDIADLIASEMKTADYYQLPEISKVELRKEIRTLALLQMGIKLKDQNSAMTSFALNIENHRLSTVNGGIDLNKIAIKRTGHVIKMQFDQAQLSALEQGGFEGFTPVIINMTPISSPLSLLGINIAKEPEVLAKA